jgi:hypothetical protein
MRFSVARFAFLSLPFISGLVRGQDAPQLEKKKFDYQVGDTQFVVKITLITFSSFFVVRCRSPEKDRNQQSLLTSRRVLAGANLQRKRRQ